MGHFMIVSKINQLEEHLKLAKEFEVSFELNDFFEPDILDDEIKLNEVIELYKKSVMPDNITMHGAFYDLAIFSRDKKIRDISYFRMEQCMEIAVKLGVKGIVFHTNYNSKLSDEVYNNYFISSTSDFLKSLLEKYSDINIYIENMFDTTPFILKEISDNLKDYNNFGVCFDWAHAIIYGKSIDIEEWIRILRDYIKHIHINDNDLVNDLHLPVGSGKIDWNLFAKCYEKYFKEHTILIETNEPDDQKRSLEFLKNLLNI